MSLPLIYVLDSSVFIEAKRRYAKATGAVLVTQERPRPGVQNPVPIPNVCEALGVAFVDTFDMLRALSTRFTWQPTM